MSDEFISIGKILNFHGINGEAKIGYTKGNEDFLLSLKSVYVKENDVFVELNIESLRFHKQFALVKFREFKTVNDVEKYKGKNIFSHYEKAKSALNAGEYLFSDLEGSKVYNQYDDYIGIVERIGETAANNILAIRTTRGKMVLVPFVDALVPEVDVENKKILINQIEGLIDDGI